MVGFGADSDERLVGWIARLGPIESCPTDLTSARARPGDEGYGRPDGVVDAADLRYFIRLWQDGCP